VYQYKDHLGNNRLSYTFLQDQLYVPGQPVQFQILEENHYYPFGLKHSNYNTNQYQFVEVENGTDYYINITQVPAGYSSAYKYKFENKEWQDELGLNVTAMDFRHYDSAIGRFNGMDRLTELAPEISPYRFAFNNPVYWNDPTGLIEEGSNGQAICPTCPNNAKFKPAIDDPDRVFEYDAELDIAIEVTELNDVEYVGTRKTETTQSNNDSSSGLNILDYLYGAGGDIGNELFKKGSYKQTNGNIGNFRDRPFKRLSNNAKAHYNFYKDLKGLKKAGVATTVILGSIEISNGAIQDYKNYTTKGSTNFKNTAIASAEVGTGIVVGWVAGAMTGAAIGTAVPIPLVGTVVGFVAGAYFGNKASKAAGNLVKEAYE
jgi:RHS repeat-associated protein